MERSREDMDSLDALEEKLVWIFGSPRTGSSWLMRMLTDAPQIRAINETYLPLHLVPIGHRVNDGEYLEHGARADDPNFFFARRYLDALRPELRQLILRGLGRQFHELGGRPDHRWILVKEPNGSHAADTTLSLLPKSRLVFLLRDGRDVIDSLVDAMLGEETWWRNVRRTASTPDPNRLRFIQQHATLWVHRTESVQRAFRSLPDDHRLLLRYEELLEDTNSQLARLFRWLDLDVSTDWIDGVVARHSFQEIPAGEKGPGKRARAATPGLWREHLTEEEKSTLDQVMGDKLTELGYSSPERARRVSSAFDSPKG
jgi:Sulfotransferase family